MDTSVTDAAPVAPDPILQLAAGFMAAKHLFVANELGVFEALADGPASLDALAARIGITPRAARISADAMVALGLLERSGAEYRNTEVAAQYLSGTTPADLRPLLRFWDQISYPAWTRLADSLAKGPTQQIFDLDDDMQRIASAGIEAILAGPANALPTVVDLSAQQRLLDIGGGTGSWTIAIAHHYEHLRATVADLPTVAEVARQRVEAAALTERVDVIACDVMRETLPSGYDAFLVANLIHYWSPQDNIELLRRIREAAHGSDAVLMIADFHTDPSHTVPIQAALMAGEFAVHLADGDVYSVDEVRGWLAEAGWTFSGHYPLVGPQSVIVAHCAADGG